MATKSRPKKSEHPELWYMFDAVNTLVAGFHEYGDRDDEEWMELQSDRLIAKRNEEKESNK